MIDGIVLAGGYSSRANTNKMLLDYQGKPIIAHVIETINKTCDRVIVVTGFYHDDLINYLKAYPQVTVVYNSQFNLGMFSSIKVGVENTKHDFFIIPGDYPLIKISTYQKLIEAVGDIRVPSHNRHLGHPIYFTKKYKDELLSTKLDNLKSFRNSYPFNIVEVDDKGILIDIDDIIDYKNLLRKE